MKCTQKRKKRSCSHSPVRVKQTLPIQLVRPIFHYEIPYGSVVQLKLRYKNLYVPSNFVKMTSMWVNEFPNNRPFCVPDQVHSCSFHVFGKEVDNVFEEDTENDYFNTTDLDYRYSAKVMLLSLPALEEFYKLCLTENSSPDHPALVIKFLVGLSEQNIPMAIGGAWSPSLDGPNPESDPAVLIRTAIRSCRTMIGIDLSQCTHWNPFVELQYSRNKGNGNHNYCTETVVMYVPDVWNCMWTESEWKTVVIEHKALLNKKVCSYEQQQRIEVEQELNELSTQLWNTTYATLKKESEALGLSSVGSKSQLIGKLIDNHSYKLQNSVGGGGENVVPEKAKDFAAQVTSTTYQSSYQSLEKAYEIPDTPTLLVYPHRTLKSGKFNCEVKPLSALMDYSITHTKEYAFEVYLFCELFNEMLTRDFGYNIFKSAVLMHAAKNHVGLTPNLIDAWKIVDGCLAEETSSPLYRIDLQLFRLSYAYFDVRSMGYVLTTDMENLFHCIGLDLSKNQVKELISLLTNSNRIQYMQVLNELYEYKYNGMAVFQDPKLAVMQVFNNNELLHINSQTMHIVPVCAPQKLSQTSVQISEKESQQLIICVNNFKEELSQMKSNLAKMETTEEKLLGIIEHMNLESETKGNISN